ncbi:MAG: cytochrome P460 family protein [Pseudomonadota bacterium]|nr:cytochrome P460 family protein [Pseudomonadota bacterium]
MNKKSVIIGSMLLAFAVSSTAGAQSGAMKEMPFGDPGSVKYAQKLWKKMAKAHLVGAYAVMSKPYKGTHPHGAVLDTIERDLKMKRNVGRVIVKRNYGGEGITVPAVYNNPSMYLKAVTVMYKREAGYDPDNQDWFWAKYSPQGEVLTNPKGMQLAGRVAKGASEGCIACHQAAPGGDYVFNHD